MFNDIDTKVAQHLDKTTRGIKQKKQKIDFQKDHRLAKGGNGRSKEMGQENNYLNRKKCNMMHEPEKDVKS